MQISQLKGLGRNIVIKARSPYFDVSRQISTPDTERKVANRVAPGGSFLTLSVRSPGIQSISRSKFYSKGQTEKGSNTEQSLAFGIRGMNLLSILCLESLTD